MISKHRHTTERSNSRRDNSRTNDASMSVDKIYQHIFNTYNALPDQSRAYTPQEINILREITLNMDRRRKHKKETEASPAIYLAELLKTYANVMKTHNMNVDSDTMMYKACLKIFLTAGINFTDRMDNFVVSNEEYRSGNDIHHVDELSSPISYDNLSDVQEVTNSDGHQKQLNVRTTLRQTLDNEMKHGSGHDNYQQHIPQRDQPFTSLDRTFLDYSNSLRETNHHHINTVNNTPSPGRDRTSINVSSRPSSAHTYTAGYTPRTIFYDRRRRTGVLGNQRRRRVASVSGYHNTKSYMNDLRITPRTSPSRSIRSSWPSSSVASPSRYV